MLVLSRYFPAVRVLCAPKHGARTPRKGYMAAETKNQKKVEKKLFSINSQKSELFVFLQKFILNEDNF